MDRTDLFGHCLHHDDRNQGVQALAILQARRLLGKDKNISSNIVCGLRAAEGECPLVKALFARPLEARHVASPRIGMSQPASPLGKGM